MDEEDKRINLVSHAADGFAYFFPHHSARWPLARWQKWGLIFIPVILAIVWLVPDIRWTVFRFYIRDLFGERSIALCFGFHAGASG